DLIGFTVIDRDPVGVHFGHGIRAARIEGGGFLLGNFLHEAVQLGSGGLIETGLLFQAEDANGFEQTQGTDAIAVGGVLRLFKADSHMRLGGQVVDLVGLHLLNNAHQTGGVGQVAVVQHKVAVVDVRILVQVVDPVGVEQAAAALDAVYFVALLQQKLGQVRTILPGDASDQSYLLAHYALSTSSLKFVDDDTGHQGLGLLDRRDQLVQSVQSTR